MLLRLKRHDDSMRAMVNDLARGIDVRFGANAVMHVSLTAREANELRAHRPLRKITILEWADQASEQWVDAATLPKVHINRPESFTRNGSVITYDNFIEDVVNGE
jgi:hypothetical protein